MKTGATLECGVVLHPAGHTRSPAMHNAAYRALGLDAAYHAWDVPPEGLATAVAGFRARGVRQLSVSIPHKEAMLALVDEQEPVVRAIGALNTVLREGDRLIGTNTDWIGALAALERVIPVQGQRAVVLGAGGTARAVVYALRQRGCEVFVLNRTRERADELVRALEAEGTGGLERLAALRPTILVNTTSVGMGEWVSPVAADALDEGMVVLDAVYAPERTRLLAEAEARGATTVGGKWMLVYQAVEQLRRWTQRLPAPPSAQALSQVVDVMADAFDRAGRPA
ncbi:MAG: shikimate dehydrogenase [Deltaproteobacteria bacterium]|nr:shikimate dehydrogenase [Deltaproteobacteria bacterium]